MLKFTYFKNSLARMTPTQRDLATKQFNILWEQYDLQVRHLRQLLQHRHITLTSYRKETKHYFQHFRKELKTRIKLISL